MQDLNKTTRVTNHHSYVGITSDLLVTVFDGNESPKTIRLDGYKKSSITFGRSESNDLVLNSPLVSREHGRFTYRIVIWRC